jgi:hypothetical protein
LLNCFPYYCTQDSKRNIRPTDAQNTAYKFEKENVSSPNIQHNNSTSKSKGNELTEMERKFRSLWLQVRDFKEDSDKHK